MLELQIEAALNRDDLRARMIKRHEQTAVPFENAAGMCFQRKFVLLDRLDRSQRDASQRCDNSRLNEIDLPLQECRTIIYLGLCRFAVGIGRGTRAAQNGIGDEYLTRARPIESSSFSKLSPDLSP